MAFEETGKHRASRIPLDYFRRPDRIERWKGNLAILALLVPLIWVGAELASNEEPQFAASPGPVASVHQTWNDRCDACHVPFTPVSTDAWAAPFLGDPQASSQRCQQCHRGPDHFKNQPAEQNCGSCHHEHGGVQASLVNLPDADCTDCHRDLGKYVKFFTNSEPIAAAITGFADGSHPDFRSIRADSGKLKFNHRQHLAAGMAPTNGGVLLRIGDLPKEFRNRYRKQQEHQADSDPVQLSCASCHQLDAGDLGVPGQRNAGAYMLPISYEKQCQACHPLTLTRKVAGNADAGHLTIPHGLQPAEIRDWLESFFIAQAARGESGLLDRELTRPLPGKKPGPLSTTVRAAVDKLVKDAERDLFTGNRMCAQCHYFGAGEKESNDNKVAASIRTGKVAELRVTPTQVPSVWYKHARFDHRAHRAVNCRECHPAAFRTDKDAPLQGEEAARSDNTVHTGVMIPGREVCAKCHSPTPSSGAGVTSPQGARFNCTECHNYHNGEHRMQGRGSSRRNPAKTLTIEEFLRGN